MNPRASSRSDSAQSLRCVFTSEQPRADRVDATAPASLSLRVGGGTMLKLLVKTSLLPAVYAASPPTPMPTAPPASSGPPVPELISLSPDRGAILWFRAIDQRLLAAPRGRRTGTAAHFSRVKRRGAARLNAHAGARSPAWRFR